MTISGTDHNPYQLDLPSSETCGVLNLNKPTDWSSRDVVNYVERRARKLKVGHAGTLDPLATGVLVVAVGTMTRLIPCLQQHPKTYRAEFTLGRSSNTDDIEGEITDLVDPPIPTREEIQSLLPRFTGEISQIPPQYSAIHIDGQRAYQLARRGEDFELPARKVTIHHLHILDYEYPRLCIEMKCGSGTYVRSLGRDLGKLLGTAAIMHSLERTAIGPYTIETATPVQDLTKENWRTFLTPQQLSLSLLPPVALDPEPLWRLARGQYVPLTRLNGIGLQTEINSQIRHLPHDSEVALFDHDRNLHGIARINRDSSELRASLMLAKLPGAR